MNYRITYLVACILILGIQATKAQSASEVLQKMVQAMEDNEAFTLNVTGTIELRESGSNSQPFSAVMYRQGEDFYSQFFESEVVVGNGKMLIVDRGAKLIFVNKTTPQYTPLAPSLMGQGLPSTTSNEWDQLEGNSDMTISENKKGNFVIEMENPDNIYYRIIMEVDKKSFLPVRYEYFYNQEMQSDYYKVSADYQFSSAKSGASKYSVSNFVKISGTDVSPVSSFKDYRVINRLK